MHKMSSHQAEQNITMYYLGIPVQLSEATDGFRYVFDPKYEVNEAHATLVAPFPATLLTPELDEHLAYVISQFKQQKICAFHYYITPQGYIFYTFNNSSGQLLSELHDNLYHYPSLMQHKKMGRSFMPHITIGKFESARAVPRSVRETLPEVCESQEILFDRVRLYGILSALEKRAHVRDYLLSVS